MVQKPPCDNVKLFCHFRILRFRCGNDCVIEHCLKHLAKFKVPADIAIVDALPRNATGKVLKRELRTQFVGEDGPKIS